jgi:hypothetical protein
MFRGPVAIICYAGGVDDDLCALDMCVRLVLAIFYDDDHDMFACPLTHEAVVVHILFNLLLFS